ncbi:hypothetical protein BJ994_000606 [Arthrobacter pigmenti]|uniref:Uncharacterized protein n=1 Tax=Arthrobacter pigmenti TaxID=271432 RepID=A0A846RIM0_9MICC|nr:hypothetical protein [Arthrobacter pigmenti]NJC21530.1 hypothetical protein [Arthrobacter pigmenti]
MAANDDDGTNLPIQVELVPDSVDPALRIPGAVAAAAIAPSAALAFFAPDDGASPYADPSALRAGGSGETYAEVAEAGPEADYAGSFDAGAADGGAGGE